jgi:hypothetical protein
MESDMPIELIAARLWNGTKWHYPNAERMVEENKRLRAEVAALKAQRDPLAEMWRELEAYTEQADKNGHGETWRTMCHGRTLDVAKVANSAAWRMKPFSAEAKAAIRAADAMEATQDAVDWIRRAKEAR